MPRPLRLAVVAAPLGVGYFARAGALQVPVSEYGAAVLNAERVAIVGGDRANGGIDDVQIYDAGQKRSRKAAI